MWTMIDKRLALVLTVLACPISAGCSRAPGNEVELLADGATIPILRQKSASHSRFGRALRAAIYDDGALAMMHIDIGPVDFDREMVLIAAMGPVPSEDYRIRIQRLWRHGSSLRADVQIHYPPPESPRHGRKASPYHAIVVPRCRLNIDNFEAGRYENIVAVQSPH